MNVYLRQQCIPLDPVNIIVYAAIHVPNACTFISSLSVLPDQCGVLCDHHGCNVQA